VVVGSLTAQADPNYLNWTASYPAPNVAQQLLDVIARLEKIDKRMGLIECALEVKKKRAFKAKLRRRAAKASR
jgi:hypothetical protein